MIGISKVKLFIQSHELHNLAAKLNWINKSSPYIIVQFKLNLDIKKKEII